MRDPARGVDLATTLTVTSTEQGLAGAVSRIPGDRDRFEPGVRVDRYELLELLGEGNMGRVYRARDTDLAREVALKRINLGRWSVAIAQARLHREARAMAQVEHAAVIRIYDVPVVDGELFVAMELARGGTLGAWLKARPRTWREIVRVFLEAGRGLAAAHQVGLVHRDIKPSNILLDAHGRAKISDFGLARTFGADDQTPDAGEDPAAAAALDASLTRTGAIAGTLAYMAPEQLTGAAIDARADQFSFCVALWEALCRVRPFRVQDARSPDAFHAAVVAGPVDPARARVPRRVRAVVRRGLAVDRAQRWGSMVELLDALDRAARPRSPRWLAAATALAAGLAITVAATRRPDHPAPAPVVCGQRDQLAAVWSPAVRDRYRSGAATAGNPREDAGWFDWYARALAGEYAAACGRAEPQRIACLDEALGDLRAAIDRPDRQYWPRLRALDRCGITPHEQAIGGVINGETLCLSADGRQIATSGLTSRRSTVRELGTSGTRPLPLEVAIRWLGDGSIAGIDGDHHPVVVDPTGHRATRTLDVAGALVDVSPDLGRVAYVAGGKLSIAELGPGGAGPPLVEPVAGVADWVPGRFSPDARRFAALSAPGYEHVYIDDLVSRHREILAFRLHVHGTGQVGIRWLDATSFAINGSAISAVAGDLWRVRVDATGHLVGPPQVLRRAERDTTFTAFDVQAGKLLVERNVIATQNITVDGTAAMPLPSSVSHVRAIAADTPHHRVLGATDPTATRWVWMSPDGTSVEPIPALDGLHSAAVTATGLAALDLRTEPPVYLAFDAAGAERARVPIEAARGTTPMLRCGDSRCLVKWNTPGGATIAAVDGGVLGAPLPIDQSALGTGRYPWEVAPDATQIAFGTVPYSKDLVVYDLARAAAHHLTSELCDDVQHGWFLPGGGFLMSCSVQHPDSRFEFTLVRRDPSGHDHLLWHGDPWIAGAVALDEHHIIVSTVSYQLSVSLFDLP